jgi:hypothetical protein
MKRSWMAVALVVLLSGLGSSAFAAHRHHRHRSSRVRCTTCRPVCKIPGLSTCAGSCGIKWCAQPIARDFWVNAKTGARLTAAKAGGAAPEAAYFQIGGEWAAMAMRTIVQTNSRGMMTKVLRSYPVAVGVASSGANIPGGGTGTFGGVPFHRIVRKCKCGKVGPWLWYTCRAEMGR